MAALTDKQRDELSELSPEIERRASESNKLGVKSTSICNPGDVLFFDYVNTSRIKVGFRASATKRVVLAVANNKTKTTTYTVAKKPKVGPKNRLLTAFTLQGNEEVIARILKKLYKRRDRASYQNIKDSLAALLGRDSYRTYNMANIKGNPIKLVLELKKD